MCVCVCVCVCSLGGSGHAYQGKQEAAASDAAGSRNESANLEDWFADWEERGMLR